MQARIVLIRLLYRLEFRRMWVLGYNKSYNRKKKRK